MEAGLHSLDDEPPNLVELRRQLVIPSLPKKMFVEGRDDPSKVVTLQKNPLNEEDRQIIKVAAYYMREAQRVENIHDMPYGLSSNEQPWFRVLFWDAYFEGKAIAWAKRQEPQRHVSS